LHGFLVRLGDRFTARFWKLATINILEANFSPLEGPSNQSNPVIGSRFHQDVADVVINSPLADLKLLGDLLVRQTSSD